MNIKKYAIVIIVLLAVLSANCAKKSQGIDELDIAIRDASDYLNENIPTGNRILILGIQSDYADIPEYIINELAANIVNDKKLSVVDKAQVDAIRREMQISGEIDDKHALEIGMFLGAQTIVTGAISGLGDRYQMRIRAVNVRTAEIQGQYNRTFDSSRLKRQR